MNVRPATVDDAGSIRAVARRSWEHDYPDIVSRETLSETVEDWYDPDDVREAIRDPLALVLVALEPGRQPRDESGSRTDGRIVGFSHGILGTEEWTGSILRLYVSPEVRRRGIGSELLERTVDALLAEGAERIQAMVLSANERGNDFYRSAGFEAVDSGRTRIGDEYHEETVYVHDP